MNGSGTLREPSANPPRVLTDDVYRERKGKERNREAEWEGDFAAVWEFYPRKEARKPALKAYLTRRREGLSVDELLTATKNYAASRAGEDPKFTLQGPTFYGPNERWRDWLKVPKRGPASEADYATGRY